MRYTNVLFALPCHVSVVCSPVQVGDSIVRKSRETLERAIQLVENTPRWAAKVVYGDTDRFVLLRSSLVCFCDV